jgi:hypothetical protein
MTLPPNPFSTRFIRPDGMEFIPTGAITPLEAWERFRRLKLRGQIVGPHGSGKTSFAHQLASIAEAEGFRVEWQTIRTGDRAPRPRGRERSLLIVEGVECLAWPRRCLFWAHTRRISGLLLTTHRPLFGWTTIATASPSLELAQELVRHLTAGHGSSRIQTADVSAAYHRCHGNLRDMLLSLYDLHESREA